MIGLITSSERAQVDALVEVLSSKRIGVVAHFYMDPQARRNNARKQWC